MKKIHMRSFHEKFYEVSALICDDVRAEINNKRTLVGVYPNVLVSNRDRLVIKELKIVVFINFYTEKIQENFKIFFHYLGNREEAFCARDMKKRISHTEQNGKISCSRIIIGCPIITIDRSTDLVVSIEVDNEEYEISRSTIKLMSA